jgi:hypothetical protein
MATETLRPQVPVDLDTDTERGIRALRDGGDDATFSYDESVGQWTASDGLAADGPLSTATTLSIQNYTFEVDSGNDELVLKGPTGVELIRQKPEGATNLLQGIEIGQFETPQDTLTQIFNAPVTTGALQGDEVGYSFAVNDQAVAVVVGEADGSGGVQSGYLAVQNPDTQSRTLVASDSASNAEITADDLGDRLELGNGLRYQVFRASTGQYETVFAIGEEGGNVQGAAAGDEGDIQLKQSGTTSALTGSVEAAYKGSGAFTFGTRSQAPGAFSFATGDSTIAGGYGQMSVGAYNQSTPQRSGLSQVQASDRVFAVGAGDNPTAQPGDSDYVDGRGRVDALYTTFRSGTYARHGLQVDRYNSNIGGYERELRIPSNIQEGILTTQVLIRNPDTKELEYVSGAGLASANVVGGTGITITDNDSLGVVEVSVSDVIGKSVQFGGDVEVLGADQGIVLESPSGTKFRVQVNDTGNLVTTGVPGQGPGTDEAGVLDYNGETLRITAGPGQTAPLLLAETYGGGDLLTINTTGDLELLEPGQGVVLVSPDGTERKRLRLGNDGLIKTETV